MPRANIKSGTVDISGLVRATSHHHAESMPLSICYCCERILQTESFTEKSNLPRSRFWRLGGSRAWRWHLGRPFLLPDFKMEKQNDKGGWQKRQRQWAHFIATYSFSDNEINLLMKVLPLWPGPASQNQCTENSVSKTLVLGGTQTIVFCP